MRLVKQWCVTAVCALASVSSAATSAVNAEGNAVMVKGNRAGAVAEATRTAEANAVGDALQKLGGTADAADALLEKHRADIVKSVQVTDDSVDGTVVTVKISATLDTAALARWAEKKGRGAGKRVLILATEQLGPHQVIAWTDYAFAVGPGSLSGNSHTQLFELVDQMGGLEATLSSAFTNAGFDVIDPKVLRGKLKPTGLEAVDLTAGQAQAIAEKGDADIVVVVKGRADQTYHAVVAESGLQSGAGNVVARAIRVRDGKVLSATTQQAAKVHLDLQTARILALNEAATLASAEMLRKLSAE